MGKFSVDIIGPYVIRTKGQKKLNLYSVIRIYPVKIWFKIMQYNDKRAISITNLVETMWLTRYPRPIEITHYQRSDFISHDFGNPPIEKQ